MKAKNHDIQDIGCWGYLSLRHMSRLILEKSFDQKNQIYTCLVTLHLMDSSVRFEHICLYSYLRQNKNGENSQYTKPSLTPG